jgi:putative sterol carrier protein
MGMPMAFHPNVAGDLDATIQYRLTGEGGGTYHVRIEDGECTAHRGPAANADLSIDAPVEVWKAISKGELDGLQAFADGKYQWSGDMNIIVRLDDLFEKTGAEQLKQPAD